MSATHSTSKAILRLRWTHKGAKEVGEHQADELRAELDGRQVGQLQELAHARKQVDRAQLPRGVHKEQHEQAKETSCSKHPSPS